MSSQRRTFLIPFESQKAFLKQEIEYPAVISSLLNVRGLERNREKVVDGKF